MDIKQKLTSAKDKIAQHQTKILATTAIVATTAAVIFRTGLKQHDDFLREKGLYEEFYTPEDEN